MLQQLSFALDWALQLIPDHWKIRSRKAPKRGEGKVLMAGGETLDLLAWLKVTPERPKEWGAEGAEGFGDLEQAFLREMVLWDALRALLDGKCRNQFDDNIDWVLSDEIHPFSFKVCAIQCGIDPDDLRAEVMCHTTGYLMAKKKKSPAEIAFLQDYTMQRRLDAIFNGRAGLAGFDQATTWLADNSELDPLSFRACCRGMGINSDELREQVAMVLTRRSAKTA